MAQQDAASVSRALDIARNCETGNDDPQAMTILQAAYQTYWEHIQAHPTSYLLTDLEFAVFNYFQERHRHDAVAQRATKRYWDNKRAVDGVSSQRS